MQDCLGGSGGVERLLMSRNKLDSPTFFCRSRTDKLLFDKFGTF